MSTSREDTNNEKDSMQMKDTVTWITACTKLSMIYSSKQPEEPATQEWLFQTAFAIIELLSYERTFVDKARLKALTTTSDLIPRNAIKSVLSAANNLGSVDEVLARMIKVLENYTSSWLFSEEEDPVIATPDDSGENSQSMQPLSSRESSPTESHGAVVNAHGERMVRVLAKVRGIPCTRKNSLKRSTCIECARLRRSCSIYQAEDKRMPESLAKAQGYLILADDNSVVWAPEGGEVLENRQTSPVNISENSHAQEKRNTSLSVNSISAHASKSQRQTITKQTEKQVYSLSSSSSVLSAVERDITSSAELLPLNSLGKDEERQNLRQRQYDSFSRSMKGKSILEQGETFAKLVKEINKVRMTQLLQSKKYLKAAMENIQKAIDEQDVEQEYLSLADDCARIYTSYIQKEVKSTH